MSITAIAERYFDAVTAGDVAGALGLFGPNAEFLAPMGALPVPDGVQAYLGGFDASFPGGRFEIGNVIEADDQVAVEGVWVGTQTGPMSLPDGTTLPATNRTVRAPFVTLFRIADGRIASHRGYWDMAGFMAQLTAPESASRAG